MIFKCIEFPGKEFSSKEEMFMALKANEEKIIGLKKAQIYKSCEKHQVSFLNLDITKIAGSLKAGFNIKEDYIYPVISTTNYMDSHKDVHFPNCFTTTVKDQQGKVYYALDHKLEWNSIAAWPKDVQMFVASLDWALVGKDYSGVTEGLVFEIPKSKVRPDVLTAIENKSSDFENSIRMVYKKIKLGINSTAKDLKSNKEYYDSRIDEIANKEQAQEDGYYWGVEELSISKEGSLVVAGGSNDATSIIISDPESTSQENKSEPAESSSLINKNLHTLFI